MKLLFAVCFLAVSLAQPIGSACPVVSYQIVSAKFPKYCVDGSSKRLSVKKCSEEKGQRFSLNAAESPDARLISIEGECISGSSPTKGPCDEASIKFSRHGPSNNMLHFSQGRCLIARGQKRVGLAKCDSSDPKQHFMLVADLSHNADVPSAFKVSVSQTKSGGNLKYSKSGGNLKYSKSGDKSKSGSKSGGSNSKKTSADLAPAPAPYGGSTYSTAGAAPAPAPISFQTGTCPIGNPTTTGGQLTDVKIFKNGQLCSSHGGTVDCSARLVSTQSGPDSSCRNMDNSLHWWPLDGASDCHGWQAVDPFGKLHDNSANNIRCSADGTALLYDQWAGSVTCGSSPVSKSFVLNECHQGRPAILWDKGRDFTCCNSDAPTSETTKTTTTASAGSTTTTASAGSGSCCSDGSAPISDGDHTTPPCADELPPTYACGSSDASEYGSSTTSVTSDSSNVVVVTTYMDSECLTTPSWKNSTFVMDASVSCNELPDSSTSNLRCFADKITYTNHPNSNDCSASPLANELYVGVCQQFPGPVPTWKKIHSPYTCRTD